MSVTQSYLDFFNGLPPAEQDALQATLSNLVDSGNDGVSVSIAARDLQLELEQLTQALTQAKAREAALLAELADINARLATLDAYLLVSFSPEVLQLRADLQKRKDIITLELTRLGIAALEARIAEVLDAVQALKAAGARSRQLMTAAAAQFGAIARVTIPNPPWTDLPGPYLPGQHLHIHADGNQDLAAASAELIINQPPAPKVTQGTVLEGDGTHRNLEVVIPEDVTVPNILLKVTVVSESGKTVTVFTDLPVVLP